MIVPVVIELLVHRNASDVEGNVDPHPRAETIENLLTRCVVKRISKNVARSCWGSRARSLVSHEEDEEREWSQQRIFPFIKEYGLLSPVSLIYDSLSHKDNVEVYHAHE